MEPGKTWKNSPLRRNIIFQTFMFGFFDCQKQWRETGGIPLMAVVLCMFSLYTWTYLCGLLTQLYTLTSSGSYFFVDSLVLLLFWNLMLFWIAYLMSTVTTHLPLAPRGLGRVSAARYFLQSDWRQMARSWWIWRPIPANSCWSRSSLWSCLFKEMWFYGLIRNGRNWDAVEIFGRIYIYTPVYIYIYILIYIHLYIHI